MNKKDSESNEHPHKNDIASFGSLHHVRMVGCCQCVEHHVIQSDIKFEAALDSFEQKVCRVVIDQCLPCLESSTEPIRRRSRDRAFPIHLCDEMCYRRSMNRMDFHPSVTTIHEDSSADEEAKNHCSSIERHHMISNHFNRMIKRCYQCRMKRLQRILDDAIAITTEAHQTMMTSEENSLE
jgi:hypothetical protein